MPFYLSDNASPQEVSEAINYLLSNLIQSPSVDQNTGQITNPGGATTYLYKYIQVKYADSFDGTVNFSNTPTNRGYYGIRNSDSSIESTSPSDYIWTKVTGGFGTTKSLYYLSTGGRQLQIAISTSAPNTSYRVDDGSAIDLDIITSVYTAGAVTPYQDFDTSVGVPAYRNGRLYYDPSTYALTYFNEVNGYDVSIGREIIVRVYNNTGSTLNIGAMVYVNGATTGFPTVALAIATDPVGSNSILGMVAQSIANGAYGYVNITGVVHGVDTSAYTAGTVLYLSSTVAGGWTTTLPLQPAYDVRIGTVIFQDATQGRVLVRTQTMPWFPSLDLIDSAASITLPTTPTIYKPATTLKAEGFTYNATTGVATVDVSGTYTITMAYHATPSASNKNIYSYFEIDTGSGFAAAPYSGLITTLINNAQAQVQATTSGYFAVGTQIRAYIWADATVTLNTINMPGTTPGTVVVPAFRATLA